MKKTKHQMTQREEILMDMFWASNEPLSALDLRDELDPSDWSKMTLYRTIQGLLDKEYLRVCGFERSNTQYARKMEPALTETEYMAKELVSRNIGKRSIGNLVMAILGEETKNSPKKNRADDKKLVEDLEHIISEIKNKEK